MVVFSRPMATGSQPSIFIFKEPLSVKLRCNLVILVATKNNQIKVVRHQLFGRRCYDATLSTEASLHIMCNSMIFYDKLTLIYIYIHIYIYKLYVYPIVSNLYPILDTTTCAAEHRVRVYQVNAVQMHGLSTGEHRLSTCRLIQKVYR